MFIKAKNGNVVETDDTDIAHRAIRDGHEVYDGDPRDKGAKAKKWEPDADDAEDTDPADPDEK